MAQTRRHAATIAAVGRGLLVLAAAACASGGAAPTTTPAAKPATKVVDNAPSRRTILTGDGGVLYGDAPVDQSRVIAAPPTVVMNAVRATYAGFSIPVTLDDPASRRIGNPDFQRSREFMGKRMVELLDCGGGITGPNAISFRIYFSLITRVKDAPGGKSEVLVQLLASGKDLASGASVDKLPCGSSGKIEQRLLDEIAKRATTP